MISGHRLRREEGKPRHLVAGELRDHCGRQAGVGPGRLLAPVLPHGQRQHHVPQQHGDIDRRVGHQRETERADRVGVDVQGEGEVDLDRVAEDALADHDRQHRRVQRDHLARPVDHNVSALGRQFGRPCIALPLPARAEPLDPDPPQHRIGRDLHLVTELFPHVLPDLALARAHADLGAVQGLLPHRVNGLPDLGGDTGMPAALAQPPLVRAADQPLLPAGPFPADQRAQADLVQGRQLRFLTVHAFQLRDLGQPTLGHRGDVRVVLRFRLTRSRLVRITAAEAGVDLHQVRETQPGQLQLVGLQIAEALGLPSPPGSGSSGS